MRGVWIEIGARRISPLTHRGHSPCGECGLKCDMLYRCAGLCRSLPMRGVWIEIKRYGLKQLPPAVTPHAGSVD